MLSYRSFVGVVAGALCLTTLSSADGAIIHLAGGTITDLTESSVTDPVPLYGDPFVAGNSMSFSTGPFAAAQAGVGSDITSGQLSFVVQADPGLFIESIHLDEIGDFLMLGSTAEVTAGGTLVATILDPFVGGFVSDPIDITPNVPLTGTGSGLWSGEAWLDLSNYQATRIRVDLDNILIASSDAPSHAAFIDKKALNVSIAFTQIPEPAAIALMSMGLAVLIRRQ
ncbi:MAG: hypothetical protein Kow00105_01860 [Phycisphaeraceae bacterium]